jgi:photosystem II stability/assembly factor-like uncharacterized protein
MLKQIILVFPLLFLLSCMQQKDKSINLAESFTPSFTTFPVKSSIRAIEVVDENTVWFAGSGGRYGYTKNAGESWEIDSIQISEHVLEFRAIAITDEALFLLNVASPAYLLKSVDQGQHWDIVYQENHPDCFYNSMKFWDNKSGIAVGDPIDGCLSVLITHDGGNNWEKLKCSDIPPTVDGEAGFAASNTNIAVRGDHAWLATGGKKARIFHTADKGESWEVMDTPMLQGGKMTGIFSIEFYDTNKGVIFGGDWENQSLNTNNKATTHDGGKTWQLMNNGKDPGYRSCVQFIPNTGEQGLMAVGIPGISLSFDAGTNWRKINNESYYTIRFAKTGNVAWLAGKNKITLMKW